MPFDDVEVTQDGYAFDALEFYEDGRSLLQWFSQEARLAPKASLPRPVAAPKKKTPAKLGEASTPPRKPRELEPPKTTPLKFPKTVTFEAKSVQAKLFGEPTAIRPLSLRVVLGGVGVIAGGDRR
jgi:hypothetical protein